MLKILPIFIIPVLASCSTLQSAKTAEVSEVLTADLARADGSWAGVATISQRRDSVFLNLSAQAPAAAGAREPWAWPGQARAHAGGVQRRGGTAPSLPPPPLLSPYAQHQPAQRGTRATMRRGCCSPTAARQGTAV